MWGLYQSIPGIHILKHPPTTQENSHAHIFKHSRKENSLNAAASYDFYLASIAGSAVWEVPSADISFK